MDKIKNSLEKRKGILHIGGCNTLDLAEEYGTPVYVYDEQRIVSNFNKLKNAFSKHYDNVKVYYAMKANNNVEILKILKNEGAGLDVATPGEIFLGKEVGFNYMLFTAAYPSEENIRFALENNTKVNLDDSSLIESLHGEPDFISFRVNPGFGSGMFKGIVTAGADAKFGIDAAEAIKAYEKAKKYGVKKFGIHMMTGSGKTDLDHWLKSTVVLLDIAGKISKSLGIKFEIIDIGGGFGIPYKPEDKELDVELIAKEICEKFKEKLKEHNLGNPNLAIEPGRYIVGDSGILLTKVTAIKKSTKKFVGVDTGMNSLIRPMLYNAYHEIVVANKLNEKPVEKVNIVGPICENTDQFAKDRMMPLIKKGDLLAILDVGAYGFAMSSQYNSIPRPAEVLVSNGESRIIRQREKFDDLK